jgi:hypothetical protein
MSRWARRKQAVLEEQQRLERDAEAAKARQEQEAKLPTDADMPDIDSLTEDSDYSGFLSPRVSESLRRMALRKLFHSPGFNIMDGMDDYDEDFTTFEALGEIVTADMKHQVEMEARKKLELARSESGQPGESSEVSDAGPAANHEQIQEQPEQGQPQDESYARDEAGEITQTIDGASEDEDPELG